MAEKTKISERLDENIAHMEELFHTCDDIKKKRMNLGKKRDVACYLTFIEVSVDMGNSALLEVLKYLRGLEREEILRVLEQNALGTSDATYFTTIEEAGDGLLTGEAVFSLTVLRKRSRFRMTVIRIWGSTRRTRKKWCVVLTRDSGIR